MVMAAFTYTSDLLLYSDHAADYVLKGTIHTQMEGQWGLE